MSEEPRKDTLKKSGNVAGSGGQTRGAPVPALFSSMYRTVKPKPVAKAAKKRVAKPRPEGDSEVKPKPNPKKPRTKKNGFKLRSAEAGKVKKRIKSHSKADFWRNLDWSKQTKEIMAEYGLSKSTVCLRRRQFAPHTLGIGWGNFGEDKQEQAEERYFGKVRKLKPVGAALYQGRKKRRTGPLMAWEVDQTCKAIVDAELSKPAKLPYKLPNGWGVSLDPLDVGGDDIF